MKKIRSILTIALLGIVSILAAQNAPTAAPKPDVRLYEIYEKVDLETWAREAPFVIERLNYYLDNAFYIYDEAELAASGKGVDNSAAKSYPIVEITNLAQFNILKLERDQNLKSHFSEEIKYRIKGTTKVLVYFSEKFFTENLNLHLKRHY